MEYEELIQNRYSVRKFTDKQVGEEKLGLLLRAGMLAPTARNNQPQRIIIVKGEDALRKIRKCTACDFGAPLVFVCCYDKKAEAHHRCTGEGFGVTDTSIVMTHMMLEAANIGLGSCWVGLFDPDKIRENFHIPDDYGIVGLLPVGYPAVLAPQTHSPRLKEGVFYVDDFS